MAGHEITPVSYPHRRGNSNNGVAILLSISMLLLIACIHRNGSRTAPEQLRSAAAETGYIDLQPGWKVQVVFPRLRSGGYVLPSIQQQATVGNTVELRAEPDFLGYEKDFYRIDRLNDRIIVHFTHGEVHDKSKKKTREAPGLMLFQLTEGSRYLRLVYLVRVSEADHDMAIISADNVGTLEQLTQGVIQHAVCEPGDQGTCRWVPRGVAVKWE
jgi:hypothetical protein